MYDTSHKNLQRRATQCASMWWAKFFGIYNKETTKGYVKFKCCSQKDMVPEEFNISKYEDNLNCTSLDHALIKNAAEQNSEDDCNEKDIKLLNNNTGVWVALEMLNKFRCNDLSKCHFF